MRGDAGPATRAIRSGPVYETAVFDVFDGVTYVKGGAVLAMIETYIGPDAFRRGLAAYFEGQKLSNATAGDLWHYLSQASGTDVAAVARSWTDQKGYPLLEVRVTCDKGRQTLELEQQRFSVDGSVDTTSLWQVPFAVSAGTAPAKRFLLVGRTGKVRDRAVHRRAVVRRLVGRLLPRPVSARAPASSGARVSGARAVRAPRAADGHVRLGQAGRIPLSEYFALLNQLRPARDPATLVLFLQADYALLEPERRDGRHAGAKVALHGYARRKLGPMLEQARLDAYRRPTRAVALGLRNELIDALGRFGDDTTLKKSRSSSTPSATVVPAIDPSLRPGVLANVGRKAMPDVYAELVKRLTTATRVEDGWLYASALAHVEDPALARQFLALTLGDTVPTQIVSWLPGMVAGQLHARRDDLCVRARQFRRAVAQELPSRLGRSCCPARRRDSTKRRAPRR